MALLRPLANPSRAVSGCDSGGVRPAKCGELRLREKISGATVNSERAARDGVAEVVGGYGGCGGGGPCPGSRRFPAIPIGAL